MADQATITARCTTLPDSKHILLPKDLDPARRPSESRLLLTAGTTERIVGHALRTDTGQSACVSPELLAALGGEGATITYRGISFWGRLGRDGSLQMQLAIAVLTLISALLSAWGTWLKSSDAAKATPWEQHTGVIVLIVAAALAWLKFRKEVTEL